MELGANKRSLIQLGVALAVLTIVVYVQFFSATGEGPAPAPATQRPAASTGRTTNQPLTPDPQAQNEPDFAADATLRKDLLERVRAIESPVVDRDIFNFGRPKPREIAGPTREEARLAQAKLEAAARKPAPRPARPAPRPAPKTVRPPDWKYYGLASSAHTEARRAFLLDGDEILLASEGSLLQGRYRITDIGLQAVKLEDTHENQEFSIPLEFPQ
ncbi:MAG: hypothetical protein OXJ37_06255 [Bryobacterales bacterium]|nr:hypothetical protein [Bryobacterales bacterium]MDE0261990.1 hypothetical protein [Bryobacterales bacterium]MDE0621789.1 hypothetical protein [Bryobacterales bacterium]